MDDKEKLRHALNEALHTGSYEELFLDDLFNLWKKDGVSPEVVFREIRALEGKVEPLMELDDDEPIPIWFGGSNSTEPDTFMQRGPSATKDATQFTNKKSPLNGLWHKHYYVHQEDFVKHNSANEARKHKNLENSPPLVRMMIRIAEGAVTGEWIIFNKENGINKYICLAKHDDGDHQIHERIQRRAS